MDEIRLVIETKEMGGDSGGSLDFQPSTILKKASSVASALPYGGEVAQGLSKTASTIDTVGKLAGGTMGTFAIAMLALKLAKEAHDFASGYVKDKRQAEELQKRAGFDNAYKRRDN